MSDLCFRFVNIPQRIFTERLQFLEAMLFVPVAKTGLPAATAPCASATVCVTVHRADNHACLSKVLGHSRSSGRFQQVRKTLDQDSQWLALDWVRILEVSSKYGGLFYLKATIDECSSNRSLVGLAARSHTFVAKSCRVARTQNVAFQHIVADTSMANIAGFGRTYVARLSEHGIHTALDFAQFYDASNGDMVDIRCQRGKMTPQQLRAFGNALVMHLRNIGQWNQHVPTGFDWTPTTPTPSPTTAEMPTTPIPPTPPTISTIDLTAMLQCNQEDNQQYCHQDFYQHQCGECMNNEHYLPASSPMQIQHQQQQQQQQEQEQQHHCDAMQDLFALAEPSLFPFISNDHHHHHHHHSPNNTNTNTNTNTDAWCDHQCVVPTDAAADHDDCVGGVCCDATLSFEPNTWHDWCCASPPGAAWVDDGDIFMPTSHRHTQAVDTHDDIDHYFA